MSVSFRDLKKNSSSQFSKLNEELAKINQPFEREEDNTWSCKTDKAGNGYAVIRFLPTPPNEDLPFVRIWSHGFQENGKWLIDNCLTTIGKDCPICASNGGLWNSGIDSDKEIARKRKRKLSYFSNIYVVKDQANPENEGKVFLFRYGKKIFDKLNDLMNPQFEDEKPVNPFDFWEGANFKLKIRQVEGYANYDKSEFEDISPLFDDDDKLEELWNNLNSLNSLVDVSKFKTYDELQDRFNKVLGTVAIKKEAKSETPWDPREDIEVAEKSFKEKAATRIAEIPSADDEEDPDLAFFKNMAS